MEKSNSYVYFALKGDDFDPSTITEWLEIEPTRTQRKGDKGEYRPTLDYSSWEISTEKGKEYLNIESLVEEIVTLLYSKIDKINLLKKKLDLESVLEIVMNVDTNPEVSTPYFGHKLKTIEFLFKTRTKTDVDIYRFNSALQ